MISLSVPPAPLTHFAPPYRRFWFAGDTGYAPVFKEIGERLGPFDLAAIPTGAYAPRWFMKPQHTDPLEAVKVHQDVRSKKSIAIHCATFPLTDEPMDEPIGLLEEAVAAAGLPREAFVTLQHGGRIATAAGADLNLPSVLTATAPQIAAVKPVAAS